MDGRMQIGSKKVIPHVACFKMFRNMNVKQATQLLPCHPPTNCAQTHGAIFAMPNVPLATQEATCINPYHYELAAPLDSSSRSSSLQIVGTDFEESLDPTASECNRPSRGSISSQGSIEIYEG